MHDVQFRAGGDFPSAWLTQHINAKEMFALHSLLAEYTAAYPSSLRHRSSWMSTVSLSSIHLTRVDLGILQHINYFWRYFPFRYEKKIGCDCVELVPTGCSAKAHV